MTDIDVSPSPLPSGFEIVILKKASAAMSAFLFRALTRKASDQHGIVLVMTLVGLAVVGLLGSTAVTMTSTDLWLAGAFKSSQIALHNAQAGVHYALSQVVLASDPDLFLSHDLPPLDRVFADHVFHATPLAGFAFEIDRQYSASITDRRYLMRVIGRATVNSPIRRTIEAVVECRSALKYGLFATVRLDLPDTGGLFSYDSRLTHRPLPELSTGEVQLGSNGEVTAESSHLELRLDGIIGLGKDDVGAQATFAYREPSPDAPLPPAMIPQGRDQEIELVAEEAIEADPLDADRLVENAAQRFQFDNHNADVESIEDDRLTSSARLQEGDYYFDELHLDAGGTLLLDVRSADVNIYAKAISLADGSALKIRTEPFCAPVRKRICGMRITWKRSIASRARAKSRSLTRARFIV
jgi:hypothetical protein